MDAHIHPAFKVASLYGLPTDLDGSTAGRRNFCSMELLSPQARLVENDAARIYIDDPHV
ncbi:MAG TPA: hypothetical protein VGN82_22445 [Bosea sp. (in: a-proteobacteria)]|jgi:hypothetical protein|uniref:hypothetical protein n=1 Tax=Bosea sp. (in: a-proteobacteria) TaxID=1871050 RepID=UPI002E130C5D|nr:hypothetical protein [Bosea sp. (in: a-proteobacteria)]